MVAVAVMVTFVVPFAFTVAFVVPLVFCVGCFCGYVCGCVCALVVAFVVAFNGVCDYVCGWLLRSQLANAGPKTMPRTNVDPKAIKMAPGGALGGVFDTSRFQERAWEHPGALISSIFEKS